MTRKSERERVSEWQKRIDVADKIYKRWEEKYHCKDLWNYYLGHQWSPEEETDKQGRRRYTINLVYPRIETQLPSRLFYHPKYHIRPSPTLSDDPGSTGDARAELQEQTLNSFVRDTRLHFKEETFLALLESYFRFGMMEVGYSSDWTDNPDAGKPVLDEEGKDVLDSDRAPVLQPEQILKRESLYFKRIPANQFRVGVNGKNQMERCDWVGYYEWQYPSDLKRNRRYKGTRDLKTTGKLAEDYSPGIYTDMEEQNELRNMCRVWKVWDLREKKRRDWAEGNDKFLLEEPLDDWEDGSPVIPFADLRPNQRLDEFYPLPPTFNWISPQDELNETREMQKIHRKRFVRKFQARDGSIKEGEKDKWESGEDGAIITILQEPGIVPITDAPLDPAISRNIPQTKEDFREISGVSSENLGIAQAETATQANIIETSTQVRETKAKDQVATWLAKIGMLAIYFLRKRMVLPFWIQVNTDLQSPGARMEAQEIARSWQQIQREDLDGVDTEVTVDVESIAPLNDPAERTAWLQALQVVADPLRGPIIMASDVLLRKTMRFFNITNEKELLALKQFGVQAVQMMLAAQQATQSGGQPGAAGPQQPPTNEDIVGQLSQQMGGIQ